VIGLSHDNAGLVLGLMLTPGIGNRTLHRVFTAASVRPDGLRVLEEPDDAVVSDALGLAPDLTRGFRASRAGSEAVLDQLEERNVVLLGYGLSSYPERLSRALGVHSPAVLFAMGNLDLLEQPGIAFCGSRQASEAGLAVAGRYATELGRQGCNVIAGYASGIDSAAHIAALEAGGTTTMVLAEGILHFRMKQLLGESVDAMNTLILSEFPPGLPWIARNAMLRNHTICGLSSAMVVVESGLTGGTFEAGTFALRAGCPLFVVAFNNPSASAAGNGHFLDRGAVPLGEESGRHSGAEDLIAVASRPSHWSEVRAGGQSDLFARADGEG